MVAGFCLFNMTFSDFLEQHHITLNKQQTAAAKRIDGATLILAVPGSGKTTVIITRLGYMIMALGTDPSQILTLTFSRASATDLTERYTRFFGSQAVMPRFSTIHSFALTVIRTYEKMSGRQAFDVLADNNQMLRSIYRRVKHSFPSDSDMADITSAITLVKNRMLKGDAIADALPDEGKFTQIYETYEAEKRREHLMDFDDMLKYALGLLRKYPELLNRFTSRYHYINVDEAQDTSTIQFALIYLLSKRRGNLFMVGDEDQSIYGFRGADPRALLFFQKMVPDGKVMLMETNHRSTAKLVAASDRFIKLNTERYAKHMITNNPQGVPPVHQWVKNTEEQYRFLINAVRHEGKNTAILYRNNESAVPIVDMFERAGVRYYLKEHNPLFFSHFTVTDIRAFFAVAQDPTDRDLFEQIYYKIDCGISREEMRSVQQPRRGETIFDTLMRRGKSWQKDKLIDAKKGFEKLKTMPPGEGVRFILSDLGYYEHLKYRVQHGYREEKIRQKIAIIKILADREPTQQAFFDRLDTLKEMMQNGGHDRSSVTLSTIHSSKGLEFDKVYIIDAVEGEFPSQEAMQDNEKGRRLLNEETRLFYVGATRARKELEFISVKGQDVSRFVRFYMQEKTPKPATQKQPKKRKTLSEMGRDYLGKMKRDAVKDRAKRRASRWQVGDTLYHTKFKTGVIESIDGSTARVKFDSSVKKIDLAACENRHLIRKVK